MSHRRNKEVENTPMPMVVSEKKPIGSLARIASLPFLAAFSLAFFRIGAWTMFRNGPGLADGAIPFTAYAVQVVTMIAIILFDRRIDYSERSFVRAVGLAAICGTVATALIISSLPPLVFIGSILHGASSGFCVTALGVYFCSITPLRSCFGLSLAFALYGLATWMFSFMPSQAIAVASLLSYPLTYACYLMAIDAEDDGARIRNQKEPDASPLRRIPWSLILLLGLCALASLITQVLVPTTEKLLDSSYKLYWPILLIIVFAFCCLWIFVLRKSVRDLWPFFMIVIFSGLLCFIAFRHDDPVFAASFLRATRECFMLFCWIVIAESAYEETIPTLPYFAGCTLGLLSVPHALTAGIQLMLPRDPSLQPSTFAVFAVTAVTFTLVIAAIAVAMHQSRRHSRSERSSQYSSGEPPAEAITAEVSLNALAAEYHLTQREEEVAQLMVKGYTLPHIAETLCISLDTVRSHSKSIYRKLGVHKKRELIDLLESQDKTQPKATKGNG